MSVINGGSKIYREHWSKAFLTFEILGVKAQKVKNIDISAFDFRVSLTISWNWKCYIGS